MAVGDRIVEYATERGSGDIVIRYPHNEYQSLGEWFAVRQRQGTTVYRRVVRVVEDWVEVEDVASLNRFENGETP